jgi:hypothetical protein
MKQPSCAFRSQPFGLGFFQTTVILHDRGSFLEEVTPVRRPISMLRREISRVRSGRGGTKQPPAVLGNKRFISAFEVARDELVEFHLGGPFKRYFTLFTPQFMPAFTLGFPFGRLGSAIEGELGEKTLSTSLSLMYLILHQFISRPFN